MLVGLPSTTATCTKHIKRQILESSMQLFLEIPQSSMAEIHFFFPRFPWASFPGCSWVLPQAFPGAFLDNYRTYSASFLGFLSARLAPRLGSSFPAPPPRVIPFLGLPWAFPDSSLGLPCALLGLSPASSKDPPWTHFEHSLGHYFANHGQGLGSWQKVSTRIRCNELGELLFDN